MSKNPGHIYIIKCSVYIYYELEIYYVNISAWFKRFTIYKLFAEFRTKPAVFLTNSQDDCESPGDQTDFFLQRM